MPPSLLVGGQKYCPIKGTMSISDQINILDHQTCESVRNVQNMKYTIFLRM